MKNILAIAALGCALLASSVEAASLSSTKSATNPTAYSIFLNGGADVFDTVSVSITPDAPATFAGANSGLNSGVPRPAGEALTYMNRKLNGDPLDDPANLGWSILGLVNNAAGLSFDGGPLGAKIETNGDLFLANVNFDSTAGRGVASVRLINAGNDVASLSIPIGIPEPASMLMAGVSMIGMLAVRRRLA